jgi:hypothetical protein
MIIVSTKLFAIFEKLRLGIEKLEYNDYQHQLMFVQPEQHAWMKPWFQQ